MTPLILAAVFGLGLDVWSLALTRGEVAEASTSLKARAAARLAVIVSLGLAVGYGLGLAVARFESGLDPIVARVLLAVAGAELVREGLDRASGSVVRSFPSSLGTWTRFARAFGLSAAVLGLAGGLVEVSASWLIGLGSASCFVAAFAGLMFGRSGNGRIESTALIIGGGVLLAVSVAPF